MHWNRLCSALRGSSQQTRKWCFWKEIVLSNTIHRLPVSAPVLSERMHICGAEQPRLIGFGWNDYFSFNLMQIKRINYYCRLKLTSLQNLFINLLYVNASAIWVANKPYESWPMTKSIKVKGWFVPRELTLYNAFQDLFVCFLPEAPENDTDRDWFQGYRENKDELFWHRAHKLCHCVIATTQFVCTMARIDIWCGF